ncbi:unnamed protein product [Lathyrus sativus]|nr:unnamed protein product [Lathyrus sativus]
MHDIFFTHHPTSIYELLKVFWANYGGISANDLDEELKWDIDLMLEQ